MRKEAKESSWDSRLKLSPVENVLAPKGQAMTRSNQHKARSHAGGPPASFPRATIPRLRRHRQPLKQYQVSRPFLGVLEPSWSRLIGRRGAPPQGGRATSEPVVLHFQGLPVVGGPQGDVGTTTPRRLCTEGVITTEDAGGGASWDEAGARSTGTSVAAAGNGRVFPS